MILSQQSQKPLLSTPATWAVSQICPPPRAATNLALHCSQDPLSSASDLQPSFCPWSSCWASGFAGWIFLHVWEGFRLSEKKQILFQCNSDSSLNYEHLTVLENSRNTWAISS